MHEQTAPAGQALRPGGREPLLDIQNLCKEFHIRGRGFGEAPKVLHALDHVSLKVYPGETLGVIGESGCGKSTLGRCIVGLHKPTSGTLCYDGAPLDYRSRGKQLHRRIQMIFQDPYSSLNPRKTCGKIVGEPMIIHNMKLTAAEREQRVATLMREVGLDAQHVHRFPHEFSGGQRQRINIARALSLNPELLVCDEPVSALDVSIQAQVLNLFAELQRQHGLTYIFISHDLGVIRHISDRIAIMYLGKVIELCSAGDIYENPMHPYTQALLSAIPPARPGKKRRSIELTGEIPSPIGARVGCPLAPRCPRCMDRCKVETPQLAQREPAHEVACFLYE